MNIYADNAATTKMSRTAIDATLPYLDRIYGNPSSLHSSGQRAAEALLSARQSIAETLGCSAKEITFTSGGSESDNQAILTAAAVGARNNKKHIISSTIEHHAVLHTLDKLKKQGFEVTLLDANENGIVRPGELEAAIRPDTALVTVMYANNEIGTVQPISELGKICREKGVLFHTDAVQAVGHLKINVAEENIDMLSLGTENLPAIMGMAAALKEAVSKIDENTARLTALRDRLISGLLEIPHTVLNGDPLNRLPGNVNVCFEGIEGESLLLLLDSKGICASSGSACTSGSLDPSHVLLAIGRPHEIAHGSLRLSLSEENTEEEIDYIIAAVKETVTYLRNMSPIWKDLQEGKRSYVIQ